MTSMVGIGWFLMARVTVKKFPLDRGECRCIDCVAYWRLFDEAELVLFMTGDKK